MSKNITDIANWEKEYPFLNEVWTFYNKFDIIRDEDTYERKIHSSCHMILKEFGKDRGEYNNFCSKLLKNLGHYSENEKSFIRSHDRCNILYNWIYNSKKKHVIPDEIINKCFEDYITISKVMLYNDACSYHLHNSFYADPMNVTLLNIFESSMGTIKNILNGEKGKINIPIQKFVCKSVQIYKDMREKYCDNAEKFKKDQIPFLDDDLDIYSNKCQKYLQEEALDTTLVTHDQSIYSSRTLSQDSNSDASESITLPENENKSSHMSSTVSTALGTVAGASSILALLYKFTPGRRWMHSGIGRNRGRISNHLYGEEPNELLFDGFQGEDMSSYNARYNIGYGSV